VYAKYILATVALVFIAAALVRRRRTGVMAHSQSRAWILVGLILGAVSAWLFARGS